MRVQASARPPSAAPPPPPGSSSKQGPKKSRSSWLVSRIDFLKFALDRRRERKAVGDGANEEDVRGQRTRRGRRRMSGNLLVFLKAIGCLSEEHQPPVRTRRLRQFVDKKTHVQPGCSSAKDKKTGKNRQCARKERPSRRDEVQHTSRHTRLHLDTKTGIPESCPSVAKYMNGADKKTYIRIYW